MGLAALELDPVTNAKALAALECLTRLLEERFAALRVLGTCVRGSVKKEDVRAHGER